MQFGDLFSDTHLSLIVFSNLDITTLFYSCSLVCKDWYDRFFVDPTCHNSLTKICFVNRVSSEMRTEFDHVFGLHSNDYKFNEYTDGYALPFHKSPHLFHELIVKSKRKKNPFERVSRKYMTLNRSSFMIPMVKDMRSARFLHYYLEWSNLIDELTVNSVNTQQVVATYSPFPNQSFSTHSFELVYQPLMKQQYCKFFTIKPREECYIYSIYVTAIHGPYFIIKKILMMDRMNDSFEFHEEYSLQFEPQYTDQLLFKHGAWEQCSMDISLLKMDDHLKVIADGQIVTSFSFTPVTNNGTNGIYYLKLPRDVMDCSVINLTQSLMWDGFELIDKDKYEKFSVIGIKFASLLPARSPLLGDFQIDTVLMVIAKKKHSVCSQPFSYMWKVLKDSSFSCNFSLENMDRICNYVTGIENFRFYNLGRNAKISCRLMHPKIESCNFYMDLLGGANSLIEIENVVKR